MLSEVRFLPPLCSDVMRSLLSGLMPDVPKTLIDKQISNQPTEAFFRDGWHVFSPASCCKQWIHMILIMWLGPQSVCCSPRWRYICCCLRYWTHWIIINSIQRAMCTVCLTMSLPVLCMHIKLGHSLHLSQYFNLQCLSNLLNQSFYNLTFWVLFYCDTIT